MPECNADTLIVLLKKEGINNVRNVVGGWAKIKEEEKAVIEKDASVLN